MIDYFQLSSQLLKKKSMFKRDKKFVNLIFVKDNHVLITVSNKI